MSNNWYETSIKSLFEDFMREHGYPVEFDTTKFILCPKLLWAFTGR